LKNPGQLAIFTKGFWPCSKRQAAIPCGPFCLVIAGWHGIPFGFFATFNFNQFAQEGRLMSKRIAFCIFWSALLFDPLLHAETVYFENFAGGWGAWSADNGVWEVGTPSTVGPPACFSGSQCAGTVLNGNYPPKTDSRLISPSIILPTVVSGENLFLYFREWHNYYYSYYLDSGQVQVSAYDPVTKTWSVFHNEALREENSSPVWSRKGVDLTAYAGKKVHLGFYHIEGDGYYFAPGWYIDDVEIVRKSSQFTGDFETGWGDWFADNGVWYVGPPTEGPTACHTGSACAGTIPNGSYSRLIFPDYQLPTVTGLNEIHLRFWNWHGTGGTGQVQISVYDPTAGTWSSWANEGVAVGPTSGVWSPKDIDLTAYSGKKVRLGFSHTNGNANAGWYIDDMTISSGTPPANPYSVVQSIGIDDLNGNVAQEEATLVRVNATNAMQVIIRDGLTKALLKTISYGTGNFEPLGLVEVPDLNKNGQREIAVLYRNGANNGIYVGLRDAKTAALIKTVGFGVVLAQSITTMGDTDNNGTLEIAVLSLIPGTKTYRLDLRDALTGALVRMISLP
jgi:hypothetical protein